MSDGADRRLLADVELGGGDESEESALLEQRAELQLREAIRRGNNGAAAAARLQIRRALTDREEAGLRAAALSEYLRGVEVGGGPAVVFQWYNRGVEPLLSTFIDPLPSRTWRSEPYGEAPFIMWRDLRASLHQVRLEDVAEVLLALIGELLFPVYGVADLAELDRLSEEEAERDGWRVKGHGVTRYPFAGDVCALCRALSEGSLRNMSVLGFIRGTFADVAKHLEYPELLFEFEHRLHELAARWLICGPKS